MVTKTRRGQQEYFQLLGMWPFTQWLMSKDESIDGIKTIRCESTEKRAVTMGSWKWHKYSTHLHLKMLSYDIMIMSMKRELQKPDKLSDQK